ncbi:hypothetical protein NHX12_011883 [Muraenolepis orangiensis]|uniref:Uncharacterized protein n=1 Tax=Muraenolepis orangiensis TaxID=630683 RepID=A0A9Q0DJT2_9TELE|nr:hypothetical protein NHX12_011883 [Muraenolepis orangiensis]
MEGRDGTMEEAALCGHILFGGRRASPLFRGQPRHSCWCSGEQDTAGPLSCLICPALCLGPPGDMPGAPVKSWTLLLLVEFG